MRVEAGMDEIGTIDKAREESRTALALEPNLLEAHWARGYVLEITGNYEEAVDEFEIAVSLNPNIARVYMALGRNQINTQELDQAVYNFTKAYSLNPTDPSPNLFISRVYGMLGEWEKGIQYGAAALRDGPSDPDLYANLRTLYYRKGNTIRRQIISTWQFAAEQILTELWWKEFRFHTIRPLSKLTVAMGWHWRASTAAVRRLQLPIR